MLVKHDTGAIVSLLERKSSLYLIRKVPSISAADVGVAMVGMLLRYRSHIHTIAADNCGEFCGHEQVVEKLKTDIGIPP
ncbi:hypothetical protein GAGA_3605 [Paraglaciecola agarilytica NO2]|uniref:Integrase catalytic domain-containing protein n=1 Tax=Paraglaciecola agarilytica NO2 TaxID=1125747 RepID=A0ABQ0IB06_9ALTE|nr:hypothetical protein [Paraglaciecola agarilytica]GAC06438.1 hypothetical protein GAGA_3605 [Paraglaciecola agarilytica NO2]